MRSTLLPLLFGLLLFSCSNQEESPNPINEGRVAYELQRTQAPDGSVISRSEELDFAHSLENVSGSRSLGGFIWKHRGPYNIGGRTKAIVQDIKNENIVVAGAASGGIWRSEDKGITWTRVMSEDMHYGISCIIQDTRSGHEQTWYAGTGEALGNSASSYSAFYTGVGMYKSTDNGLTWEHMPSTANTTTSSLNEEWDLVHAIVIDTSNKTETEIYAACYGAIMRSVDGGANWEKVLEADGIMGTSMHSDLEIASNGKIYAFLSADVSNSGSGFWTSTSGELGSWTSITPTIASNYRRMILALNPVEENTLFAFGDVPNSGKPYHNSWSITDTHYVSLWKYDITQNEWTDLSNNLPERQYTFDGLNLQNGYNIVCQFHPNNSNILVLGGTNLFLSTDAATSSDNWSWIGGFSKDGVMGQLDIGYPNHHSDNHALFFDYFNENGLFSGHDGGLSYTSNMLGEVAWHDLTNGYLTAQAYTVAMNMSNSDEALISGLQDNGMPYVSSKDAKKDWEYTLGGDGAYGAIADNGTVYGSEQRGNAYKLNLDADGKPISRSRVTPSGASGFHFINPFILDPNDNNVMYMVAGTRLWRQNNLSAIDSTDNNLNTISEGWDRYSDSLRNGLTCLKATKGEDRRLYFGGIGGMFRMDNPQTGDPQWQDISDGLKSSGWVNDIAIDPRDPDKFVVVYSNYKIYSLYYTEDGGENYIKVAGNLEERSSGSGNGPSCRSMTIHPLENGKTAYLLGTSVGLFYTDTLMDEATVWTQVAKEEIGNVVVDMVVSRTSDNTVAIATHGNGIYTAQISEEWHLNSVKEIDEPVLKLYPNPTIGELNIDLIKGGTIVSIYNSLGQKVLAPDVQYGRNKIDVTLLPKGMYQVEAIRNGKRSVQQLLID